MIIMLLCSCVSAARTTWKQAKKTYHSMVEYYTRDVENNLSNISDYLLRISETADYYGMTNCEEDKESMNNLSRQRLYNQLNEDILVYSSADYFFIFQDKYADIMMVESAKKKAKIQSQNIREQLKRLLESRASLEHEKVRQSRESVMPDLYMSQEDSSEMSLLKTNVMDVQKEYMVQFITGAKDIDAEWDGYISALNNVGLERYLELLQKAYDESSFAK